MGSASNRSRRQAEEFERDAVVLVRSSGETVTGVARGLGVCGTGIGRTRADRSQEAPGELTTADREEFLLRRGRNREQVGAVGPRWRVEEAFQTEKGPAGLDRASGPPLPLLDPLGHSGDACPCLLAVVPADEHELRPGPGDLIPCPATKSSACSSASSSGPSVTRLIGSAGPPGDAVTRQDHVPAITADKPRLRQ